MTDLETRPVPPELSMFTHIEATQQTCGLLIVHLMAQVQLDDPKLTDAERDSIIDGLKTIQGEIEAGQFDWRVDLEDVHMNIEARLTDRIGVTGKKLHTGRSRNDQVATDIRLWLRDEIDLILAEITRLQKGLLEQAEREQQWHQSRRVFSGCCHERRAWDWVPAVLGIRTERRWIGL